MNRNSIMKIFSRISSLKILLNDHKVIYHKVIRAQNTSSLKHYQLETPLFKKLLTDELMLLSNVFKKNNYELRIAGGAVRDLIMNILPHDIDLATNALPEQMIKIFDQENIRIINKNGLKHGTVPVRINDKQNFEITTLRIDVKTYGRHAEVEFTNDWHKDAIRRDLTVNSLFLDFDGKIHDYVNGMDDINNRVVRFVGIPDKRVKEDYLRILRYFRFYGRVRNDCSQHDKDSIEAIKNNADGLKNISGERIGYELRIILKQKFADSLMRMFYDLNLASHMGLPKNPNLQEFEKIYKDCSNNNLQPMTLLAALLNNEQDILNLDERIKLSNDEKYSMIAIKKFKNTLKTFNDDEKIIRFLIKQFIHPKALLNRPLNKYSAIELLKYLNRVDLIERVSNLTVPKFTLSTEFIVKHKILDSKKQKMLPIEEYSKGKKIKFSKLLYDLKLKWIDSDLKLTNQDLLNMIDEKFLYDYLKK